MDIIKYIKKPDLILPIFGILSILATILLWNAHFIPLGMVDLVFVLILLFLLALYKPQWVFWLFICAIPLEIISLVPEQFGFYIRPYQILGAFAGLGLVIRTFSETRSLRLFQWGHIDTALSIFVVAGFISSIFSPYIDISIKQSIIAGSFVLLYFVVRSFVKTSDDVKRLLPFLFGTSMLIMLYAIAQNWAYMSYGGGSEVMPGRPNATFAEADWLGMYIVFIIAIILSCFYALRTSKGTRSYLAKILLYELLVVSFIAIILTVARSAWLGMIAVVLTYSVFIALLTDKVERWKELGKSIVLTLSALIIAMFFILGLQLTEFELNNRLQSTSSGLQEITIACEKGGTAPDQIHNISELSAYSCQHINLEDIAMFTSSGYRVSKTLRTDPNVDIRKNTWVTSLQQIRENTIFGIGWGTISSFLGKDAQGTQLNASNIFLEIWLGTGLLGFLSFLGIIFFILWSGIKMVYYRSANDRYIGVTIILTSLAIYIPNLFNSGQFLGFFWVWLGVISFFVLSDKK